MQLEALAPSSASSASTSQVSTSTLVYDLDIFILVIILLFSLLNAPRALAYIANNRSDLFQGYFLPALRTQRSPSGVTLQSTGKGPLESFVPGLEPAAALKRPWHLPVYFSLRHPAASFMQYRVLENYTAVQALLVAGYTAAVFYAAFYGSNPFTDPSRAGWVIASQIPVVYALATKNNVIGLLVGVGYEKVRVSEWIQS